MPQSEPSNASPAISDLIPTYGETFPDGTLIELVRAAGSATPKLLFWDGRDQTIGDVIRHRAKSYIARTIPETIFQALNLPCRAGPFVSTSELLGEICKLIHSFVGLPEKFTALAGRFVFATWLVDAMPRAPRILIDGPDIMRARQLLQLSKCVWRRGLRSAALSPAGFCSLPSGMRFTLLVGETSVSPRLANLLEATLVRDALITKGGELRDLFGAQMILRDTGFDDENWPPATIQIPCAPMGDRVPILGSEQQRLIAEEFQPLLLAFRIANFRAACATTFDVSKFSIPLREISASLAAATPGVIDLQTELTELLRDEDNEIKSARWVDLNTVIVESILVFCHEGKMETAYVREIAEMATKILEGRGVSREIDPGEVGRRLKTSGFSTEPRDARGVKLRLTNDVCVRAHDLAHEFDAPGAGNGVS